MRRGLVTLTLCVFSLSLYGCVETVKGVSKNDIKLESKYAFNKDKLEANSMVAKIIEDATSDKGIMLDFEVSKLSEDELGAFRRSIMLSNDYFTSVDYDGTRQVICLSGYGALMYIVILWRDANILSVERLVNLQ